MLPLLCIPALVKAQTPQFQVNPETGETQKQFAARTQWWREAKFGMFIHWGLYAVPADSTKGLGEWYMNNWQMQVKDYEKFAPQFDPVKFDAKKWVQVAKDAGMKYIVITSKHHDGFCMFDSKLTDYTITKATPFHRDPMKELAAECKKQGIVLCFYHSVMDWHEPDYLPRRPWETQTRPADGADLDRYMQHMEGQLRELLTNYGRIGVIWFDGGWEHNAAQEHSLEVVKLIRSLQPGILINDRINLPEDFSTPEQTIPANALPNGRLWETCMTLNDTWGYAKNDHNWKPADDLIHKLCDIASKGGNFLLNVGPTDQGEFTPETIERLETVGKWMKRNSVSIYDTEKSPFKRLPFDGRCTRKGNTLYLQVFHWPDTGLTLTGLKTPLKSATALLGNERLKVETAADGNVTVSKPGQIDPVATVIELRLAAPPVVENIALAIRPAADGRFTLMAADATIEGNTAQVETKGGGSPNIGYWTNAKDVVAWTLTVPKEGNYKVEIEYACEEGAAGSVYRLLVGDAKEGTEGTVHGTGDWTNFQTETLAGTLKLPAGAQTVRVAPQTMPHGAVMNLRRIVLTPVP
ncbi:MAG TPA: alpha-L-fucosidase [Chthonomonadaceae bacterium]|nr:alpha-L-fucosidase [Chthonomonadaceae bacterium]